MVGVPGRSKGCNTCRKRKISCTLERPQCSQCLKSGRTCLGYQRERIFISAVGALPSSGTKSERDRQPQPSLTYSSKSPSHAVIKDLRSSTCYAPQQSNISINNLYNTSVRHQMLGSYVSQYYPNTAASPLFGRLWLTLIPDMPTPTQALETSAFALCTAKLGRQSNDRDLIQNSLNLYIQGLNQLQRALWDPEMMYKDETLGACMLLAMYELMECPSNGRSGYLSHHNGCAQLIQLRGAEAHATGLGHSIFLHFRVMGTLEAFVSKSTFLTDPLWKTMPFSAKPKSPFDRLIDILLEAPRLLRKADQLANVPPQLMLQEAVDLLKGCWEADRDLTLFYDQLKDFAKGPLYWPLFANTSDTKSMTQSNGLFPVSFQFIDIRIGTTLALYWATLTILWSGMCHLYELIGNLTLLNPTVNGQLAGTIMASPKHDDSGEFTLPTPGHCKDFRTVAHNVCQSVEFCMNDEAGVGAMVAPLNMVIDALVSWPGYDREVLWAKEALERIQKRGMRSIQYLRGAGDCKT